eukprot:m51a1_g14451 hypothetical protein (561) ;mRNA; f:626261-628324
MASRPPLPLAISWALALALRACAQLSPVTPAPFCRAAAASVLCADPGRYALASSASAPADDALRGGAGDARVLFVSGGAENTSRAADLVDGWRTYAQPAGRGVAWPPAPCGLKARAWAAGVAVAEGGHSVRVGLAAPAVVNTLVVYHRTMAVGADAEVRVRSPGTDAWLLVVSARRTASAHVRTDAAAPGPPGTSDGSLSSFAQEFVFADVAADALEYTADSCGVHAPDRLWLLELEAYRSNQTAVRPLYSLARVPDGSVLRVQVHAAPSEPAVAQWTNGTALLTSVAGSRVCQAAWDSAISAAGALFEGGLRVPQARECARSPAASSSLVLRVHAESSLWGVQLPPRSWLATVAFNQSTGDISSVVFSDYDLQLVLKASWQSFGEVSVSEGEQLDLVLRLESPSLSYEMAAPYTAALSTDPEPYGRPGRPRSVQEVKIEQRGDIAADGTPIRLRMDKPPWPGAECDRCYYLHVGGTIEPGEETLYATRPVFFLPKWRASALLVQVVVLMAATLALVVAGLCVIRWRNSRKYLRLDQEAPRDPNAYSHSIELNANNRAQL